MTELLMLDLLVISPQLTLLLNKTHGICMSPTLHGKPCCIQPEHRSADILVCKEYDTLLSVSCIANTVAHLLLDLKEIMPVAIDAMGTDSTSSYGSHDDKSVGVDTRFVAQMSLSFLLS